MKIQKIKEIQNIGTFTNFKGGGALEFDKLTFIYGLNTYGKTTLTDIFQSLKYNNPEIITSRKSIPSISTLQKVHLTIKEDTESQLFFQNGSWQSNNLSENLEIFGTEFIHKNLFTGLNVERENKENFTEFILGESGVELNNKIAENKKTLGEKIKELKNNIPVFVKKQDKEVIQEFINYDISTLDKVEIDKNLIKKKIEKQEEEKRLKAPQKILQLSNISEYNLPKIDIVNYFKNINNLLQKDYSNIKDEVLLKINNHIENNFNKKSDAENWIKYGLENCKDIKNGNCSFCGQNLENAQDLMNAYDSYFNEAYNNFINKTEKELNKNIESIDSFIFSQENLLRINFSTILKFKDLIKDKYFQDNLIELENKINTLEESTLNSIKEKGLQLISEKSTEKNKKPYVKIEEIKLEQFPLKITEYEGVLKSIKEILKKLQTSITDFKNQYKDIKKVQENIKTLEKEIASLEYQKARIEQDSDCKKCIILRKEFSELDVIIKKQEEELQVNQSQYLDKYFDKINILFKQFGSDNFILIRESNNRGHLPVYFLKIQFHQQDIRNEELKKVLSESDKRALALAIFWTKIELKTDEEKQKTIIILDDPITSFDNERSRNFISYVKEYYNKLSQILIFTHYDFFIRQYSEYTNSKLKIYELSKKNIEGNITSIIQKFDIDYFLKSDYLKYYDNINKFINYEESDFDETHLRIFFENCYLPIFKDKISEEKRIKYISELSPANHKVIFENEEATRNFAKNMMTDLYNFNFKEK